MLLRLATLLLFSCLVLCPSLASAQVTTKPENKTPPANQPRTTLPAATGPKVELTFEAGKVVLELYPDRAPQTVDNFLAYVRDGFYDATLIHRVVDDMLIQGGGYAKDGALKTTRGAIASEGGNGLSNLRGTIAMARKTSDAGSARSQFFINLVDNPAFDYRDANAAHRQGFTVFGRVAQGMEVIDMLRKVPTSASGKFRSGFPQKPVVLLKARVLDPK